MYLLQYVVPWYCPITYFCHMYSTKYYSFMLSILKTDNLVGQLLDITKFPSKIALPSFWVGQKRTIFINLNAAKSFYLKNLKVGHIY